MLKVAKFSLIKNVSRLLALSKTINYYPFISSLNYLNTNSSVSALGSFYLGRVSFLAISLYI